MKRKICYISFFRVNQPPTSSIREELYPIYSSNELPLLEENCSLLPEEPNGPKEEKNQAEKRRKGHQHLQGHQGQQGSQDIQGFQGSKGHQGEQGSKGHLSQQGQIDLDGHQKLRNRPKNPCYEGFEGYQGQHGPHKILYGRKGCQGSTQGQLEPEGYQELYAPQNDEGSRHLEESDPQSRLGYGNFVYQVFREENKKITHCEGKILDK